jgi:hypothetical protein
VRQLAPKTELLPWLAGGWLLCFAWHVWLVSDVRRCVVQHLGAEDGPSVEVPASSMDPTRVELPVRADSPSGPPVLHSLSGLRRLIRT